MRTPTTLRGLGSLVTGFARTGLLLLVHARPGRSRPEFGAPHYRGGSGLCWCGHRLVSLRRLPACVWEIEGADDVLIALEPPSDSAIDTMLEAIRQWRS